MAATPAQTQEPVAIEKESVTRNEGGCSKFIDWLWVTNRGSDGDQELFVKQTFRELIIYLVFLIFVCIISFGMSSTSMYYYTKLMMDLFLESESKDGVSFRSISTVKDFWKYAEGPLMDGLYWDTWYNGQSLPPTTEGYIYYENKLMGVPRLRHLRVRTNSCSVNEEFQNFISDCYSVYSFESEEKQAFGIGLSGENNSAFKYHSNEELEGFIYWGKLHMYSGAGYIQDLSLKREESEKMIQNLYSNLWIQRGGRAVFVSFTVYNANINLFCVITLLVEFPSTGGAVPSWSFLTVKLIRYVSDFDFFVMACEIIFVVFILYYVVEEILEIVNSGCSYFADFWNVLDLLLIFMAVLCSVFNVLRATIVDKKLRQLLEQPNEYANFNFLGFWETRFNNAVAIMVFLAWVKVFKYISFNKTMTQLSTTLSRCAKDLLGFFIMFFIVFLAFTQLGYLLFGTQVNDFCTFMNSFFTLFRIILGDFDFHQLEQANRILGPIFFMLFVFFVFFVLINMFLAIINDTYSEVKSDMAKQTDVFIMSDYLKQTYDKFWDRLVTTKEKLEGFEKILRTEGYSERSVDFNEWKTELEKQGYNEDDIETIFVKFDVDGDRTLDPSEQKKMLEELEKQKGAMDGGKKKSSALVTTFGDQEEGEDSDEEGIGGTKEFVPFDEFVSLVRRVDRMEGTMGGIITNIDAVLAQLATLKY
ncbi:polycystic kidney disease 2-like 1 protein [Aplysia californica]|uniref:Polycystic kidney disease 2-like 1 protein n=1 Tax=Aplysia californica TaxID=6500 RepID=A0ABM0JPU9_APLCA|nr:polycystic kidney disease 2-like 1 protein [Aplysia californica]